MKKYFILICLFIFNSACKQENGVVDSHDHELHVEQIKGLHGGKLFEKDGFGIRVTIYEPDIPPQSRVYVYENGNPIDPALVTLVTELHRIDIVDTINYTKQDDYLIGDRVVEEPILLM